MISDYQLSRIPNGASFRCDTLFRLLINKWSFTWLILLDLCAILARCKVNALEPSLIPFFYIYIGDDRIVNVIG